MSVYDAEKTRLIDNSESLELSSDALFSPFESTLMVAESRGSFPTPPQELSAKHQHLAIGDVLKGRYQLLQKLGEGGMGMVFKALDLLLVETKSRNPYVAIKVLSPSLAQNQVMVAALQRECEKTQSLKHDNIISVNAFDRDGDHVFISMEFLSGQPLSDLIKQTQAGGLPLNRAWPLINKMGNALAYAHQKNIVHRDFKPANVFVTAENEVKILDFGIASKIESGVAEVGADVSDIDTPTRLVSTGLTPAYASLEMIRGLAPDPRDDVYAFGLVVYELLTGVHPHKRRPADEVFYLQQANDGKQGPKPVAGLSRRQWRALRAAIALVQAKRPKNLYDWLDKFSPAAKDLSLTWAGLLVIALLGISFGLNFFVSPSKTISNESEPQKTPKTAEVFQKNQVVETNTAIPIAPNNTEVTKVINVLSPVTELSDAVLAIAAGKPKYRIGDAFTLNVHIEKAGYLRVANLSPSGEISEILPNPYQANRVKANSDFQIPPKSKNIKLMVSAPVGVYKIIAVFSESPLPEVKNIIDTDGNVVSELQSTKIVSKVIQYEVVKK